MAKKPIPKAAKAPAKPVKAKAKRKVSPKPQRTVRTDRARATFLEHLEATCNVTAAARKAGMGRTAAYEWRKDDEAFAAAWAEAEEAAADRLEEVAFERGTSGKSDRMLEILLKGHRPKFRENKRLEHSGPDGGPIEYRGLDDEEVEARIRAHLNANTAAD